MSERTDRSNPPADPQHIIERQQHELERLRRDLERAERDRERLRRENERLKRDLEAARRAGFRQAAPFAKPHRQGTGRPPGRRAGAAYGRHGRRRIPRRIDETYHGSLPPQCPDCGGPVHETRVAAQYQEELPIVRPVVRQFQVHIGRCAHCGRRVQGRHLLQTSDALGAAAVQLGPQAVALGVFLHLHVGVPLGKIAHLFRNQFGLVVTPSTLVHALHRTARRAEPTYAALQAQIRGSPVVSPDETGWKVDRVLHWLWVFATPDTTVYHIRPGRGFADAAAVLGPAFDGVLVRDGWAPYRQFTRALHQTCLAHLLRRCRELQQDHPRSRWVPQIHALLTAGLALRDRREAGQLSAHSLARQRGRCLAQLAHLLTTRASSPHLQRFAAHLALEFPAVFAFLWDPSIDATNWRAEQAIRPAVVTRKVCGGNRSPRGAHTQEILASVLRTSQQRDLNPTKIFATVLRSPHPIVPRQLDARTQ